MAVCRGNCALTFTLTDHESISEFQGFHTKGGQIWYEVRHRQSCAASRMVYPPPTLSCRQRLNCMDRRDALPPLDDQVKTIKVKNPITQEFHGSHGTYTQANIEKQRSYNLPQWKALSEESNHQPPAKRGERRRNQEKPSKGASAKFRTPPVNGKKRGPGRPRTRPIVTPVKADEDAEDTNESKVQVPPTPTSPPLKATRLKKEHLSDDEDAKPKGRQPKSVSSRRQHNKQSQAEIIDEEAFRDFDYRVHNQHEWTTERIQELETAYWKGLTFNNPLYGADMPGSLFDDSTPNWNVAKLENLLDVLGQKVPGVNTAYLYLGMWKASFAWHLEDVDLYSINYIHFGAPKQWYSISQEDARRFEAAMRSKYLETLPYIFFFNRIQASGPTMQRIAINFYDIRHILFPHNSFSPNIISR